jgi:hypothetical protein
MENNQRNNNNGNGKSNRPKRKHEPKQTTNSNSQQKQQPQRKRRVSVDRDVEVVVVSNVPHRFFYENPRMNQAIDLEHIGDEEYLTIGDIRAILNSSRKVLEGFSLVITEVLDNQYTLEDVLIFLGLDKKYEEYYSLTGKQMGSPIDVTDIKEFLLNSPYNAFEKTMAKIDEKLRARVIEASVVMFKAKDFGDFNKMRVIEGYVNDELFADAQDTELDDDVYI